MLQLFRADRRRHRDERGASAVEYGLLVAGIAAMVVALVMSLGGLIQGSFQQTCNTVKTGSGAASTC